MAYSLAIVAGAVLCAAAPQSGIASRRSSSIEVPQEAPSSAGLPFSGFMSYSIEFAFFPDYAGNFSKPNTYSDNLLTNIASYAGSKPTIRVGGNTQDFAIFDASLPTATVEIYNAAITTDYPTNITFGPAFFESYQTWPSVRFSHGFNLGSNTTAARQALLDSVPYACTALSNGKLLHWELGNEPDLYAESGARPPNWSNQDYVDEWLKWSQAMGPEFVAACPELPITYWAPSFALTSNRTIGGLNPLTVWELGLDADKDIAVITSHNYISGADTPGVTLQNTLMNHTSTVASVAKQITLRKNLAALPHSEQPELPFMLGETNSLYHQGRPGLSNTFGAALWGVDFGLYCAANNIRRINMHQGTDYRYQSWQPIDTNKTSIGTKAPYYGNIAIAAFLGDIAAAPPSVVNLPLAEEEEAAYASFVGGKLTKMMVINMMEYNATDYNAEYNSNFTRPIANYSLQLPKTAAGKTIFLQRLMANGSDAITGVTFNGYSYNYDLDEGKPVLLQNVTTGEQIQVNADGLASVQVPWSSAVILELDPLLQ